MKPAISFVALAVLLILPIAATAEPTITIYTDAATYESGDVIEVSLSAENDDVAMPVAVYVGIILPDDDIWCMQYDGWQHCVDPWLPLIEVPAWYELARTRYWVVDLPSGRPPIENSGSYCFAAVLTYPGTFEFVSNASLAPFTYQATTPVAVTLVPVPSGSFLMGSPVDEAGRDYDEDPQRTVNVSAFKMTDREITQKQWEGVMGWNDSDFRGDDLPVEQVTWFDCVSFCNKLSELHGYQKCYTIDVAVYQGNHITWAELSCDFGAGGYRLPTEAEWEYACRAGTRTRFCSGGADSDVDRVGWWYDNSGSSTHPVGEKESNAWGLLDMHGNVFEWCWDWYDEEYYLFQPDPDRDPRGPSTGSQRVARGGSLYSDLQSCRSACRSRCAPAYRLNQLGFRVAQAHAGEPSEINMVSIPAGSFLMGSPDGEAGRSYDEGPQRTVNISAFEMSDTEITQKQWKDVMGWNDSDFKVNDYPVEQVTWFDCLSFCNKLSELNGHEKCYTMTNITYDHDHITLADVSLDFGAKGYRLPTEAEWEYACRAGTTTRFHAGDSDSDLSRAGWFSANSGSSTQGVGGRESNHWDLYDMHGNVWEWCWDRYDDDYYGTRPDPDGDPTGPVSGWDRVARGGCWFSKSHVCRSASRGMSSSSDRFNCVGFRVARTGTSEPSVVTLVSIPAGSFFMGSPDSEAGRSYDEGPQREVNVSAFEMSNTEITQCQWKEVMGWVDPYFVGDDHPVERVTWFDCVDFCNRLSEAENLTQCYTISNIVYHESLIDHIISADVACDFEAIGYRLPTEAEWEYACRAGTTTLYYTGDSDSDLDRAAWYSANAGSTTHIVGEKEPNAWGLYDMQGNVYEWCWDWYDDDYYETCPNPDSDPTGPERGYYRTMRGGDWSEEALICRSANRSTTYPKDRYFDLGLRVIKSGG